ncbi:MAG: serine protease [Candidatus Aminicenantes bacterium]|nr:serine protease [Candidatus Aminicenantes bacterium]
MSHKLIKVVVFAALAGMAILFAVTRGSADIKGAVVRIEVVNQKSSYVDPWKMNSQGDRTGSGCVIAGERILTNAHLVADQMYIKVQKAGDVEKYTAEVEFVAHDCDLALLKVKDPAFFKGVHPIALGGLPREGDGVNVYGFPTGGSKISVTQGVVSRIEIKRYRHSRRFSPVIQIDASLNPGNSGGPVLKGDRLVGIAFQVLEKSENNGDMIPVPVIERFFNDIKDGRYDGFPQIGINFQKMESLAMRAFLKLKPRQTGMYIRSVDFNSMARGVIREGDVLLAIDNVPVANDGTIVFVANERIDFPYHLIKFQVNDEVVLTLLRGGVEMKKTVRLSPYGELVPYPQYDEKPEFLVFAGLVFMPETYNYLRTWGENQPPDDLNYHYKYGKVGENYSQVVLLVKVLANDVNRGYQDMTDEIVTRVNGRPIGKFSDLAAALAKPLGNFHVLELSYGRKIVLDAAAATKAQAEILKKYNIPKDRSDNLK